MSCLKGFSIVFYLVMFISLNGFVSADIWSRHINSNHADEIICSESEVWVRVENGGLTRWSTLEATRYNDQTGFPTNHINGMVFDDEGRFITLALKDIFIYENGDLNLLTNAPNYSDNLCFADGYLLIEDKPKGLLKLNGETWDPVPELSDYEIYYMTEDPRGGFWVITISNDQESSQIIYFNDGIKKKFTQNEISNESIKKLYIDSYGIVWGLLGQRGIAWYDGEGWNCFYWEGETKHFVHNIIRDKDGTVWLSGHRDGLFSFDVEKLELHSSYENINVLWVENAYEKGIWVGTEGGLDLCFGKNIIPFRIDNLLPISNIPTAITIDYEGNLWCGDQHGDIAYLNKNTWSFFPGSNITGTEWSSPGALRCLNISKSSGVWAGFAWDVIRYTGNVWTSYVDILSPEIGSDYTCIVEGPEGDIWIRGFKGLARWHEEEWDFHTNIRSVGSLCYDKDGFLWASSSDGIMKFNGNEWNLIYQPGDFTWDCYPKTITFIEDGTFWGASNSAIAVFDEEKIIRYFDEDDGLKKLPDIGSFYIEKISQTMDGSIWILMHAGLTHYDGVQFRTYSIDDAGFSFFTVEKSDMAIDPTGRIFIASTFGLTEFIPTSVTLKMNLFAEGLAYKAGDMLSLSMNLNNYGPDETGDLYFVMMDPDGKIYSGLDWSESVHPAALNITIPEGFIMPVIDVIKVELPASSPPISKPGKYYFAIALADSGSTYFRAKAVTSIEVIQ